MKNWKTTLFGCVGAAGLFLSHSATPIVATIGNIVCIACTALLGVSAKDKNVTGGSVSQ